MLIAAHNKTGVCRPTFVDIVHVTFIDDFPAATTYRDRCHRPTLRLGEHAMIISYRTVRIVYTDC